VPFDAESPVTVALKQVSEAPIPPREIDPELPPALEGVVLRALEKDPAQRFANADEFIEALHRARIAPDEVVVTAPAPMEEILEDEERSSRRWWLWLLILLAIAAIAFGLYQLLTPEQVKVPQVVGTQAATASQILQDDGFEVQQNNIESDDTPRGEVAGQNPRAGTLADEGSTVTINVSAGPGQVSVPTVAGQSREEAEAALREAGLDVTVEEVFSDTVDSGQVVDTSPAAGTLVERGTAVTLRVSKGAERVEVPDVTGESEDDARSAIQGASLRVGKVTEEESDEEPGTVLEQSPAAGKRVAKNSAVDITVAKGVEIPDVVDETEEDATQALEDAGFEVRVRQRTVTTDDDVGIVLEQRPEAGEERAQGSRVTIIVGELATATPTPTATPTATAVP
jgi:eukaryotic-like serine/threonine-protein kinase